MHAILLATDGTDASTAATRHAIELARNAGAVLHVLAVRPAAFFGAGGPAFVTRLEEVPAARDVARAAAAEGCAAGVQAEAHAVEGTDVETIVRVAEELGAGLIVVGCREARGAGHGRAASVSRELAACSTIPVTVVRGNDAVVE